MRIFFGIVVGVVLAGIVAAMVAFFAVKHAFDVGERDRSNDVTRDYELADFDAISVGGVYELTVETGPDYSVRVSGPPEELARIDVEVRDGRLRFGRNDGDVKLRQMGVTAVVTLPALTAIDVSGVGEADVAGVDADDFSVALSGVGKVTLAGRCANLYATVSGVGELDARALECETANVTLSGLGEASIYASASVDATLSGVGSIDVYGSPDTVSKTKSFLGDISVK
ncbi:MAG: head GIN domain-containing protein [Pseudomonadota bacterium]